MGASIQYSPEMDGEERSVIWVKFLSFAHPGDGECHHGETSKR